MAMNNPRRAPRHLGLGLADPPVIVPEAVYAEGLEKNRRSLVGRLVCPRRHDLYPMINSLPYEWPVDQSRLRGRIIGNRKFQFLFETERDLEMVLWSGPYTYNGWLVVLQRWEDVQGPDFLKSVPMWVSIRGIPIQYLCEGTIREIASSMGEVMEVELDDAMIDFSSVRARVNISVNTRLCFKKVVRFGSGDTRIVSLRYEDIACSKARFKCCRNCGSLKHLTNSCSHVWVDVPDPNDPSLSPPPHEPSADGSAENDAEGGASSEDLKQLELAEDAVGVTQVQTEMAGTCSSGGSKSKFEGVEEEADDIVEKRTRGSSDATEGLMANVKPLEEG